MSESAVLFRSGAIELAGDMFVPPEVGAGVVLIGGSGPTDRSNGGYFAAHREALAGHGLAVLWYDKRGVGDSGDDYRLGGLDELASDARAAHAFMRARLDGRPVGVLGHSEGGWVALRAATARSEFGFVVTTSTPPCSPAEQDLYAVHRWLDSQELTASELDATHELYAKLQDLAVADAEFVAAADLLDRSPAAPILRPALGRFDQHQWAFWKRERDHNPLIDHAALISPHLAIFGLDDPLLPAVDSASGFTQSATSGSRSPTASVTIHLVPNANHRLRTPTNDQPSTDLFELICAWIIAITTRP